MGARRNDILQGTLALLVLQTLASGRKMHGYAIRPGRVDREIDRELAFHLTERIEELQAAGLSETESVRAALRQIGNRTYLTERTRDVDINQRVEAALRNFRHAARGLRQAPGFTATGMAILALGIGADSGVFSAVWAVVLRPLPFP